MSKNKKIIKNYKRFRRISVHYYSKKKKKFRSPIYNNICAPKIPIYKRIYTLLLLLSGSQVRESQKWQSRQNDVSKSIPSGHVWFSSLRQ